MSDLPPWVFGILVLAAALASLFFLFRRRRPPVAEDPYTKGLELWLAGDLTGARSFLRKAIDHDPDGVDPYLQLGNLLRQTGDAKRAAVLHRGLTVRNDIPQVKRGTITLSLAEDLLSLRRFQEAREVLDSLQDLATNSPRFWRARFSQWLGLEQASEAALALRTAAQLCEGIAGEEFAKQFGLFQANRALQHCRQGEAGKAKRLLKEIPREGPTATKVFYLQAWLAKAGNDPVGSVAAAIKGLLASPVERDLFWPLLQEVLREGEPEDQVVTLLEEACQAEGSPPSLWVSLALVYEKQNRRPEALALLEEKAKAARLPLPATVPYLELLASENPQSEIGRVWSILDLPGLAPSGWRCGHCGLERGEVVWFCPACLRFDSFAPAQTKEALSVAVPIP